MDELKFVLKCFGFAALLLVFSQLKTNDVSVENRLQASLVNSQMSDFVNKTAQGGAKLIQNVYKFCIEKINSGRKSEVSHSAPLAAASLQLQPVQITKPAPAQAELNTEDVEPVEDTE